MLRILNRVLLQQQASSSSGKRVGLNDMLRKFKLAGAHPDVIWGIDAQKAQQNGEALIRLENLLHLRNSNQLRSSSAQSTEAMPQEFRFWLPPKNTKSSPVASSSSSTSTSLLEVSTTLNPLATHVIVKEQLSRLFRAAGIFDDFELGDGKVEANLESVLRTAEVKMSEHVEQVSPLYIRGDKSIERLRQFGIVVVVCDDDKEYLVTMPEGSRGGEQGPTMAIKGEFQPDQSTQDYLDERGLQPFDLRLAGSYTSVEHFVRCFERLEAMYEQHRGLAMRAGVCIVVHVTADRHFVAEDGSIVLTVKNMVSWEEYLLSLSQDIWRRCVDLHKQWRLDAAPKHQEFRRKLLRLADIFNFFRFDVEMRIGQQVLWQQEIIDRLHKDEATIRGAINKYNLKSPLLKNRGTIVVRQRLTSIIEKDKEIMFRVHGDGKFLLSSKATTPQMLKALKDNIKIVERAVTDYGNQVAVLEHLSRSIPIDFNIDTEWRKSHESNLCHALETFVGTMKANQGPLIGFLTNLLQERPQKQQPQQQSSVAYQAEQRRKQMSKRMLWVVSDKFDILPSGVVYVPWNVDFESIKRMLLTSSSSSSSSSTPRRPSS